MIKSSSIRINKLFQYIIGIFIAFICFSTLQAQNGIKFRDNYWLEKALQIAIIEDKNVFIDTYTPWCGPCKLMDIQFQDPELGSFFNKHYINVKINMDSEYGAAIKSKYDVFFLPTLLIVDKYGNVKYASEGAITSDELLAFGEHFYNEVYRPENVVNLHEQVADKPMEVISEVKQFDTEDLKSKEFENTLPAKVEKTREEELITNTNPSEEKMLTSKEETEEKIASFSSSTEFSAELKKQERILYTQNDVEQNPDFLYNLTYLKLQLQDGTQWAAADKYLATQKDWSTLKNMRFIYDFVRRPGTEMFNHLITNQADYDILFGKNNVSRSISIMINMHLYQGYPRPTPDESKKLFDILDPLVSEQATYNYLLERYEKDENYEEYVPLALKYIKEINPDDFSTINKIAIYYESSTTDLGVNQLIKMMEHAIEIQGGSYYILYDTIAALYFKKGNKRKALESIEKAKELATNSGVDLSRINQLRSLILEL